MPSCVAVKVTPPMTTLDRPSGALTVMVPVVVSLVSPPLVRPCSLTVAWPVAPPLPSTGTMLGTPSVLQLMVMVSVAVLGSPSASVIV